VAQFEYAPAPLPDDLRRSYTRHGHQSELTFTALMVRNRDEFGTLSAVVDGDTELSWRELMDAAARFGGFLAGNGIGSGDVVTWQLPNWWEALVVGYGIWAAGAISNPVVPIYRGLELRQIVEAVRPRCVITAAEFRGCDHVELLASTCAEVGFAPDRLVVVRGRAPGWTTFDDTIAGQAHIDVHVDPDDPALVGFTSGTTSGAKGVVHSSRSYLALPQRLTRSVAYGWDDRSYMPAPVAHATGMLMAIAIPLYTGCSVVVRDRWDPEVAVDDMRRCRVTYSGGATVFVQELLGALAARRLAELPLRTGYMCGGSTVPTAVAEAAEAAGLQAYRSYGMTEAPCVTGGDRADSLAIRLGTDGRVAPGCEIRVVGPDGGPVPQGQVGEFVLRAPQRALGYIRPEHTKEAFDDAGWFRTGDVGCIDADEALTVTGRVKEIINRGGEKISGREVEDALIRHPAVLEAAVVPAPHPRFGEQPAAFVLVRPGVAASDAELAGFLRAAGLAPQKIPTVWRYVDELPRTPSGKVKKFVLQAELAADPAGPAG
jgi:acyl-CoA synthetase